MSADDLILFAYSWDSRNFSFKWYYVFKTYLCLGPYVCPDGICVVPAVWTGPWHTIPFYSLCQLILCFQLMIKDGKVSSSLFIWLNAPDLVFLFRNNEPNGNFSCILYGLSQLFMAANSLSIVKLSQRIQNLWFSLTSRCTYLGLLRCPYGFNPVPVGWTGPNIYFNFFTLSANWHSFLADH